MKVKIGDTVLVEMTVVSVRSDFILAVDHPEDNPTIIRANKIREVLKRPFKVGDIVRWECASNDYEIVAIHGDIAWCINESNKLHAIKSLSSLSRKD